MATATLGTIGVRIMPQTKPPMRPELADIVRQIRALRTITKQTGFITNRSIGNMLSRLSVADLVAVGEALQIKPEDFEHYMR
jgi:hypothetical protein